MVKKKKTRCAIIWCERLTEKTIPVYETPGDGDASFLREICLRCAKAIGIGPYGDLPKADFVKKQVLKAKRDAKKNRK